MVLIHKPTVEQHTYGMIFTQLMNTFKPHIYSELLADTLMNKTALDHER